MKVRYLSLILVAVSVLIIGGLIVAAISPNSPSSTGTPLPTNCPTSAISFPSSPRSKPSLIFALIEKSETYYSGNYIAQTRSVIKQMIPRVLEPGDRFFLAWISADIQLRDIGKVIFFDQSVSTVTGQMLTPAPPTLSPVPSLTPIDPAAGQLKRLEATSFAATLATTSTAAAARYSCAFSMYMAQNADAIAKLSQSRSDAIQAFVAPVDKAFPTDYKPFEQQDAVPIVDTLALAGDLIHHECVPDKFEHCVLLIFSDMQDNVRGWQTTPATPRPDLSRINVVNVIYHCKYATACEPWTTPWDHNFAAYHALSSNYVLNGDKEDVLVQSLTDEMNSILNNKDRPAN